jgi:hypothetical protein
MDKEKMVIDKDLAFAMTKAYDDRKKEPGRIIIDVEEDTKYVYIPMKRLKAYIDEYKDAEGIRVYFGVIDNYTINSVNFSCKKEHQKHTTVILKATDKNSLIGIKPLIALPSSITNYEPLDEFGICPPTTPPGGTCDEIDT